MGKALEIRVRGFAIDLAFKVVTNERGTIGC